MTKPSEDLLNNILFGSTLTIVAVLVGILAISKYQGHDLRTLIDSSTWYLWRDYRAQPCQLVFTKAAGESQYLSPLSARPITTVL